MEAEVSNHPIAKNKRTNSILFGIRSFIINLCGLQLYIFC